MSLGGKFPLVCVILGSSGASISYAGKGDCVDSYARTLTYDNVNVDVAMSAIDFYNTFSNTRMKYSNSRYLGNLTSSTKTISNTLSLDDGRESLDITNKYNNVIANAGTIFSTPLMFYQYLIPALVNGSSYLPANTTCYRLTDMNLVSGYFTNPNNPNNVYTKMTRTLEYFDNQNDAIDSTALPNNSGFFYKGNSVLTCSNTYSTVAYMKIVDDIGENNIFTMIVSFGENNSNRFLPIYQGYTLYVRQALWQSIDGTVSQDVTQLICELVQQALKNVGSPANAANVITAWNVSNDPVVNPSTAVPNGDVVLNIDTNNYFNILTDVSFGKVKSLLLTADFYPTNVSPLNTGLTSLYPYYTF